MKSISLHTLGCKLNYSETSTIAKDFSSRGFELRDYGEPSDIFVLNTCSVTNNADKECRQIIRSVLNKNPETYIIVTGCYAQLQPREISEIKGVDLVLGISEKFRIFEYAENFEKENLSCIFTTPINEIKNIDGAYSSDNDSRTRAYLKIQDGCNYKCSFCTIPLARGKSRSLPIDKVIDNARKLIDSGYKEIVLTGVNTGDYDYDSAGNNINPKSKIHNSKLTDVLYELDKLPVERIRISSIEPNLLSDEIISFAKSSDKFCNHFHIPLQSGDNEILKLMRRRYNSQQYEELVCKLNEEINDVCIGADVIVGFPGESESRFENTYKFLSGLQTGYLHVFTYSERKNTDAASFPQRVDVSQRRNRSELLRNLSNEKRSKFYKKFSGTKQKVLFETQKCDDYIEGYTENYIRVRARATFVNENEIAEVYLKEADGVKPVECKIV